MTRGYEVVEDPAVGVSVSAARPLQSMRRLQRIAEAIAGDIEVATAFLKAERRIWKLDECCWMWRARPRSI